MADVKVGNVVQLKSGGPKMTVEQIGDDGFGKTTAWCVWFEKTDMKRGTFPPETLEIWSQ